MKRIIQSSEEFKKLKGQLIGKSPYLPLQRTHVSHFSQGTNTTEKGEEIPDFLLVSLTPYLWGQTVDIRNVRMIVNYGLAQVRFLNKSRIGEHIRLVTFLYNIQQKKAITQVEISFCIENKERNIKCIEGKAIFLYYFNEKQCL